MILVKLGPVFHRSTSLIFFFGSAATELREMTYMQGFRNSKYECRGIEPQTAKFLFKQSQYVPLTAKRKCPLGWFHGETSMA